jgi:hypothetical protein
VITGRPTNQSSARWSRSTKRPRHALDYFLLNTISTRLFFCRPSGSSEPSGLCSERRAPARQIRCWRGVLSQLLGQRATAAPPQLLAARVWRYRRERAVFCLAQPTKSSYRASVPPMSSKHAAFITRAPASWPATHEQLVKHQVKAKLAERHRTRREPYVRQLTILQDRIRREYFTGLTGTGQPL